MKVLKYFLLFILLIHVSCKKQTAATIIARGFVKDKLSLAPIPNVPLVIYRCETGWYLGADRCEDAIIFTTNSNGYYYGAFNQESGYFYKIGILSNPIIALHEYPSKISGIDNRFDFFVNRIKTLRLKLNNVRHDKNWISVSVNNDEQDNRLSYTLYDNGNPSYNLDTVFNIKIEAGRNYFAHVSLINKLADYTFTDAEIFTQAFNAVDTNSVSLDFFIR